MVKHIRSLLILALGLLAGMLFGAHMSAGASTGAKPCTVPTHVPRPVTRPANATPTVVKPLATPTPRPSGTGAGASLPEHAAHTARRVPVPNNLAVQPDDRAAILTYNADMRPGSTDPPGVHGYKVTWGPQSNPSQFSALTMYRILELQPLVNGQPYVASVQAIDNDGHISAPSSPVSFSGSSARVDALRSQMTGFFDDFNDPSLSMKAPDSLKWNIAVSQCNDDPTRNLMALNDQFHVHNMIDDNNCDRGQVVSRPRATFDFTGRTGTIVFDMDGLQRRDVWYLDLVPRLMDIDGDVNLEGGPTLSGTADSLRFKQQGDDFSVGYIDDHGVETDFANSASGSFAGKLTYDNRTLIPNVRKHIVLHISQTHADIYVNGVEEYATNALHLPYSKATVLWVAASYNTRKSNEDRVLFHWDNFGFDGPTPTTQTHNYVDAGYSGGGDFSDVSSTPVTKTIAIPDSLAGERAERLLFTMQMSGPNIYAWSPSDRVTVNGYSCPVAQPGPSTIPQSTLVSPIAPYGVVCALPLGTLHTGANTLIFHLQNAGVLNVHVEVDFVTGHAPAYTQPLLAGMPMNLPDIGPGATVDQVGSALTWQSPQGPFSVSGDVPIRYHVQEESALNGTGKVPGIKEIQITLDGKVVMDRLTDTQVPAPAVYDTYMLDTSKLSKGNHTLRLLAWNVHGTPSIPDYPNMSTSEATDWPIVIQVR